MGEIQIADPIVALSHGFECQITQNDFKIAS